MEGKIIYRVYVKDERYSGVGQVLLGNAKGVADAEKRAIAWCRRNRRKEMPRPFIQSIELVGAIDFAV